MCDKDAAQAPELASAPSEAGDSVRIALGHALCQLGGLGLWRSGRADHPVYTDEAVLHLICCPLTSKLKQPATHVGGP